MTTLLKPVVGTVSHIDPGPALLAARGVDLMKTYGKGDAAVCALDGVSVEFERGRFTAVMGPSGSGKSTLMHCMAGLDVPTSGRSFVGEQEIASLDDAGLTELRRDRIGFVFQSFNLGPERGCAGGRGRIGDRAGSGRAGGTGPQGPGARDGRVRGDDQIGRPSHRDRHSELHPGCLRTAGSHRALRRP